jgi:4-hydroxy-2-oxoheptanedioate aldolase
MPNAVRRLWAEGRPVINGWLSIPDGFSAEIMAQGGFDSITVDLQHGVQDYLSMVACFQAMQSRPVLPMARVPWNEPGIVGKVLDAGAYGVICPMVNTAEDAAALVSAMRYPPLGRRSNGPIRAGLYGSGDYQSTANDEVLCIPMIETRQAVENLDGILDVEGVDAVYIGPSDLGFSMGLAPLLDREEPEILAIYEAVLAATGKRGQRAGVHCLSPAYAARMLRMGFGLVTTDSDSGLLLKAARSAVQMARAGQV